MKDRCYHKVKKTYRHFPSAFASMAIAKCRKAEGKVRYSPKGKALRRWKREKWVDTVSGKPCGEGGRTEYCRPTVRVSSKTPTTVRQLGRKGVKKQIRAKRRTGMGHRTRTARPQKK